MPLSEDDRRKLDQIEQALRNEDPMFATTVTSVHQRHRAIVEGLGFFLGCEPTEPVPRSGRSR